MVARPPRLSRIARLGLVGALALVSAACSSTPPLTPEQMREPQLREIHTAFVRAIEKAREDPNTTWRSGWLGNIGIHLSGDDVRGLCYEWQGLVYAGVRATVARVGWSATGITINHGTSSEHHAVVVYDPARARRALLLEEPYPGRP